MKQFRTLITIVVLMLSSIAVSAQTSVETLTIGVLVTDADINADHATEIRQAVQLAIDEINDAGGVDNANNSDIYRLQAVFKDVANADEVAQAIAELTQEGAIAILGPESNALLPDLSNLEVPLLTMGSGLDGIYHQTSEFVYQLRANDDTLARIALLFAVEELNAEDLAVISADSRYGQIATNAILEDVAELDDVDLILDRTRNNTSDVSAIVADIVNDNPDTILVADRFDNFVGFMDELSASEWSGELVYLYDNTDLVTVSVNDDIDLYSLSIWFNLADDQMSDDFVDLYAETYGEMPSTLGVLYYDGLNLINAGLASAGDDRVALSNWFDVNADYTGVQGNYTAGNDSGELIRSAFVLQVVDGRLEEEQRYSFELDTFTVVSQ
ncbi:MAG: ABC transporter substrate-binding protein [Chloroflexota bacterium]